MAITYREEPLITRSEPTEVERLRSLFDQLQAENERLIRSYGDQSIAMDCLESENERLREIEANVDKVTADWSRRCQELEDERDIFKRTLDKRDGEVERLRDALKEICNMNSGEGRDSCLMQEVADEALGGYEAE
jgi:predicted RNase H-like nuclease (RuvC/YqgF family)